MRPGETAGLMILAVLTLAGIGAAFLLVTLGNIAGLLLRGVLG